MILDAPDLYFWRIPSTVTFIQQCREQRRLCQVLYKQSTNILLVNIRRCQVGTYLTNLLPTLFHTQLKDKLRGTEGSSFLVGTVSRDVTVWYPAGRKQYLDTDVCSYICTVMHGCIAGHSACKNRSLLERKGIAGVKEMEGFFLSLMKPSCREMLIQSMGRAPSPTLQRPPMLLRHTI